MTDNSDMSIARQLEIAAQFDEQNPPTIAWHKALIDALENMAGLSDETKRFLINKPLDPIEELKKSSS